MNEQSIFTAAVEEPSAERAAFLDAACGTDRELRDRVEKLIGLDAHAGASPGLPRRRQSPSAA